MFLKGFPKITFDKKEVTDLGRRLQVISRIKNNVALFSHYNIMDDERPEDVSLKHYGDPELYWVILLMNDICDPYYEWVLSDKDLLEYIERIYGVENIYAVHHYETTEASDLGAGVWVNQGTPFSTAVSNFSYYSQENEKKRRIKILNPIYMQQVIAEYEREIK